MIELDSASLVYHDHGREVFACRDVSLSVSEGEFVGILGPSGSGKSSLLYLLSGLKNPTSGAASLDGERYANLSDAERSVLRKRDFGFVFQQPYLIGYLSALENVALAVPGDEPQQRALSLLGELRIGDKAHRMPAELSGGEKQRVCIARALASKPRVVFADEPTASLDHRSGAQAVGMLRELRNGALVMVTHDPSMLEGADRLLRIEEGALVLSDSSS